MNNLGDFRKDWQQQQRKQILVEISLSCLINLKTLNLDGGAGACSLDDETQPARKSCPHWCLDQLFFLVQSKLGKLITALMNWIPEDMPRSLKVHRILPEKPYSMSPTSSAAWCSPCSRCSLLNSHVFMHVFSVTRNH